MRQCRQQFLVMFCVVLMAALCGAAAGLLTARELAIKDSASRLLTFAGSASNAADDYAATARQTLSAMNSSAYAACSEGELGYFRKLVYRSAFVKDAGRIRDGRIGCSAIVGRAALTKARVTPAIVEPDGVKLSWDLPAFRIGNEPTLLVQWKSAFIVTDFRLRRDDMPGSVHLNVRMTCATGPRIESASDTQVPRFIHDGQATVGDTLYATHCSTRHPHCVTASMSIADALMLDRSQLLGLTGLSALAGSAFGLIGAFAYLRTCSMERQLRRALAKGELEMAYQPIVELATGRIVGAEALARWTDEGGQPVSPQVFVAIAEQRGFVDEITRFAIGRALDEFSAILRLHPELRLHVNATAPDLCDARFLPMLDAAIQRAGVRPRNLVIELTETSMATREAVAEGIQRLRQAGYEVDIDDFGTGYSSLSYLNEMAVDAIKIDRSFTQAIGTESVTVCILPQILAMAEALNLQVIVEGIETAEQAAYFAGSHRRILAQGWLFGRPVPVHLFAQAVLAGSVYYRPPVAHCDETDFALPLSAG